MDRAQDRLRQGLAAFCRAAEENHLQLDGVHVAATGRRAVEHRWSADERANTYSVSKTITAMAIGIAIGEGRLELGDPLLGHLPHLAAGAAPGAEAITIEHLVTMTSGITWRWEDPDADHDGDPAATALAAPLGARPGTAFAYRGVSTYLAGRVIHAATGQDLREYLLARLFTPMGIANPQWHRCPLGFPLGATGLFLRTSEIAALTRLLLDGGRHHGDAQLVPATFVAQMVATDVDAREHHSTGASAAHPESTRYGLGIWHCTRDGAWRMDGIYGQLGIALPHHDACIAISAHHQGPTSAIIDAVWDHLVTALD